MKRLLLMLAALAVAMPSVAHAATATYTAPYQAGSKGGDVFNAVYADAPSGRILVVRANPAGLSTGLGCTGQGGYANFFQPHTATGTVHSVTVNYDVSLVDPYSWIHVGVKQNGRYIDSIDHPGITAGPGNVVVPLDPTPDGRIAAPVTGLITIEFGIQVSSACPNIDGGGAQFTSVVVDES
ncbi:MAG: hypothetical protein LC750_09355 [Actinobacteria bacterium]|nr:hypothetical protein [Actinomycetota bacterium]